MLYFYRYVPKMDSYRVKKILIFVLITHKTDYPVKTRTEQNLKALLESIYLV